MKYTSLLLLLVACHSSAEVAPEGCDLATHQTAMAAIAALKEVCTDYLITEDNLLNIRTVASQQCNTPAPHLYDQSKIPAMKRSLLKGLESDGESFCEKMLIALHPTNDMIAARQVFEQLPIEQKLSRGACFEYTNLMQSVYDFYRKAYKGEISLNNAQMAINSFSSGYASNMRAAGVLPLRYLDILGMRAEMKDIAFSGGNADERKEKLRYSTYKQCMEATAPHVRNLQRQAQRYDYSQR